MSGNMPQPHERDLTRIVLGIRDLFAGRSNASGQFTCAINQATTTVTAKNCGTQSRIVITPVTANAATEMGNGTIYISSVAVGQFVVTHANNATTGRTFNYAICG